ncbi:VOC family protein [Sandaracinobacteroides sp. A072]|uniref:VOC family protein n=1 Tax=Sandaracinobacteroides sp. A072 TaxID=3461146 RepID=UPI004042534D
MSESSARHLKGIHHAAYRCLDAAQTLWFYEEVIGLRFAGVVLADGIEGTYVDSCYAHIFFELPDKSYIAFFDQPDGARPESAARKDSFDVHLAIEVKSEEDLLAMQARMRAHGKSCHGPIDHGFVKSVYMYDPNGLQVEFTCRVPDHDAILAEEERTGRARLADWTKETRAAKIALFGEDAIRIPPDKPGAA